MHHLSSRFRVVFACLAISIPSAALAAEEALDEVVVTATLRRQSLLDTHASITLLDARTLRDAGRQHFEDVLTMVPNLHWAGATSRPRFFQLRGIGEREQWEGAPNPSVGFLIDDIDFSGIGMAATLYDVDRIEVLRGPQGMRYGANSLAGLISLRSAAPEREFAFASDASLGEYGAQSLGATLTGPAGSSSAWRLAAQRSRDDGYRTDTYLGRDDTEARDELTARAKWRWQPGDDTTLDFTWLHTDLDNGYDSWSLDNSRRSLADRPGKDSQEADGIAARFETPAGRFGTATLIATAAKADGEYSYDEDWGNPDSWAPYVYDYFYRSLTERTQRSFEARLASPEAAKPGEVAWLVGAYALDVGYDLEEERNGALEDPAFPGLYVAHDYLSSEYDATNVALFAQLDGKLGERWGWTFGVRTEERDAHYVDAGMQSEAPRATDARERDRMLGGQAGLHWNVSPTQRWFATLSRGYKAGGFNLGRGAELRDRFAPEYLWSLDVGMKGEWLDRRLSADVTAFFMKRVDMQVTTGIQEPGAAGSYVFVTDNAAGGSNAGIEGSLRWRATERLEFGGTLGLLRTRYSDYRPEGIDVSDRDQAHAPEYQLSLNAAWRANGWMARVDFAAIDDFYFDVPPANQRAAAHALLHLKGGYEAERWSAHLWIRNALDEEYAVRGFYFGNEPPEWRDTRYVQLGAPRQAGISASWRF
jgi:outer membrane receptor protein involved in Fe transport